MLPPCPPPDLGIFGAPCPPLTGTLLPWPQVSALRRLAKPMSERVAGRVVPKPPMLDSGAEVSASTTSSEAESGARSVSTIVRQWNRKINHFLGDHPASAVHGTRPARWGGAGEGAQGNRAPHPQPPPPWLSALRRGWGPGEASPGKHPQPHPPWRPVAVSSRRGGPHPTRWPLSPGRSSRRRGPARASARPRGSSGSRWSAGSSTSSCRG